jgi:CDP-diacylglycerol pyrophosphatase
MMVRGRGGVALSATLLLLGSSTASWAAWSTRDALWAVVRSCVVAKQTLGTALPCLKVDLTEGAEQGFVVLRAPLSSTHTLVVPTARVEGTESRALTKPEAAAYWRAALDSARFVVDALPGRISIADVGFAINARTGRSQDQLHIHLDCVRPGVQAALKRRGAGLNERWKRLAFALEGQRYWAMKIGPGQIREQNLFQSLARLPGGTQAAGSPTIAVISAGQ